MQLTDKDPQLTRVEYLRKKMTEVALEKGFSSVESVQISQELDALLNELQDQKTPVC
ncbi:Spo0E family sporulation regulatory protein-aspartic acid phosphatase [Halobacillus litoralis]|uniref:Spo0E family sporulation regulatory protein-aspartic acid phosphatase n=1 Tax=Halobacillus litoralis TaxID=45668 RepID=UPI001CFEABA4|nr:aspartyl-phosphate phosphatase Spo0E family protein [Halobacillus litoralis]